MQPPQAFGHAAGNTKNIKHSVILLVKEVVGDLEIVSHCP